MFIAFCSLSVDVEQTMKISVSGCLKDVKPMSLGPRIDDVRCDSATKDIPDQLDVEHSSEKAAAKFQCEQCQLEKAHGNLCEIADQGSI